jgi:hypothetical protein
MNTAEAIKAAREALEAVLTIANNTDGIAGWHKNGDLATWTELLPEVPAALEALAALSALQAQEPVAWMNKSGSNIIPASAKQRLLESRGLGGEFSVAARTAERYTIPLYASPPVERGKPHTLRSYQYGNASTDLATSMADRIDAALAEKGQGK